MNQEKSSSEIVEFQKLSEKLSSPDGLMKLVNVISEAFSLNLTIVLQMIGINRNLSRRYKGKRLLINIGCGDAILEGCVNSDVAPTFGGMIRLFKGRQALGDRVFINVLYSDKHLNSVADGIIFSHVLEHLPPHLAIPALKNIKKMLKPGGILRISVPDLTLYDQPNIPRNQNFKTRIIAKNSLIYGWGHKFMYNSDLLKALLGHCGFKKIQSVQANEGPLGHADFDRRKGETLYLLAYA